MLFLVNANGVPSESRIVKVDDSSGPPPVRQRIARRVLPRRLQPVRLHVRGPQHRPRRQPRALELGFRRRKRRIVARPEPYLHGPGDIYGSIDGGGWRRSHRDVLAPAHRAGPRVPARPHRQQPGDRHQADRHAHLDGRAGAVDVGLPQRRRSHLDAERRTARREPELRPTDHLRLQGLRGGDDDLLERGHGRVHGRAVERGPGGGLHRRMCRAHLLLHRSEHRRRRHGDGLELDLRRRRDLQRRSPGHAVRGRRAPTPSRSP